MKAFLYICALLLAFCGGILCTSCRTSKPTPPPAVETLPPELVNLDKPTDERGPVEVKKGLFASIFGNKTASTPVKTQIPGGGPKKCKNCTFNVVSGDQTTTTVGKKAQAAVGEGATATSIGKAKGPTAIGDSASATDNTKAGQRGGAAATAAHATATATTEKNGIPWWLWLIIAGLVSYGGIRLYKRFTPV